MTEDNDIKQMATDESNKTPFKDKLSYLIDGLSARLVAYATGVDDGNVVRAWAKGDEIDREEHHPETMYQKIDCLYFITKVLSYQDSFNVIKSWLLGMNPDLEDKSPVSCIRTGRFKDAIGAATAFLANG